ncbi:MAG TPA: tetratricopeptide repeat protein [Phycisphaerae bacterium]|nr:tetratricopeptide repeat protein [Phycisphaerae bacterium]
MRASLAGILSWASLLAAMGVGPAMGAQPASAGADPAAKLVGHILVDNAYHRSSEARISAQLGAREAQILLQFAHDLDPQDVHTLKLLVEAAATTGETDVQREAVRALIRLDPGDLVAQVQYIDLIASGSQALDDRARIYQSALGKSALDPQIRSEVAVRLSRITRERGDVDGARDLLKQALQLNDVNMEALRESVRLAEKPEDRLAALIALLSVNPLDPAAWGETARIMEGANLHAQAADFLITAIEQTQLSAQQPPAEVYLALGIDLAIAGRYAEANPILSGLAKLPDAPLHALVAARLLQQQYTPPASMPGAASQPSADSLAAAIHKQLDDAVKADPKSPVVLADAIWTDLSIFPAPSSQLTEWMKSYQELVPADDASVARFNGWQRLREGKLDEARAILEKIAPNDPYARLGLSRVLIAQKKLNEAAQQLQDVWSTHPTGIFAFQVANAASTAGGGGQGIRLAPTAASQQLLQMLKQLPSAAEVAHRKPRDLQLITTDLPKREYAFGEPIYLTVRINNTTDHAAPVGADGLIKTTAGILAKISGVEAENLGLVGTEDLRRTFRLDRRAAIDARVRIDQGKLDEIFYRRPMQVVPISLALVTAPLGTTDTPAPGLGGQVVAGGGFQRNPFPMKLPDDVAKLIQNATGGTGDLQLIQAQIVGVAAAALSQKVNSTQPSPTDDKGALSGALDKAQAALVDLLQSPSPLLRAYLLLTLPQDGLGDAAGRIAGMSGDGDRIVRAAWACRMSAIATAPGDAGASALDALRKQADAEKDPLVRRWITTLLEDAGQAASLPATQAK